MADEQVNKNIGNFKDLTGMAFGRWTVISYAGKYRWLCKCGCERGTIRIVATAELVHGRSKSCRCYAIDINTKYPRASTKNTMREYHAWWSARQRCADPSGPAYHNYGGRGITMCARWMESFGHFYADMGKCPPKMTLDRMDNDGPYSPENCRWSSRATQTRNRRKTIMVTHEGRTLSLGEWSEISGIPYDTLHGRLERDSPLLAPIRNCGRHKRPS